MMIIAVDHYLRYTLSYHEVQEFLYDYGIPGRHTMIYHWMLEYGKLLYWNWKKKTNRSSICRSKVLRDG